MESTIDDMEQMKMENVIVNVKKLCVIVVLSIVHKLEPRHPFHQNTKHVDVRVLSDIIKIYSKQCF